MDVDVELMDRVCQHVADLEDDIQGLGAGWLLSVLRGLEQHMDPVVYIQTILDVRNELQGIVEERGLEDW